MQALWSIPELLQYAKASCSIYNSASMTLEEVIDVMKQAGSKNQMTVRLHTGDPSLYGAIREQMDQLDKDNISYDVVPGVSSFCGAAAALKAEYAFAECIPVCYYYTHGKEKLLCPKRRNCIACSSSGKPWSSFLSTGMLEQLSQRLLAGGYQTDTPCGNCI